MTTAALRKAGSPALRDVVAMCVARATSNTPVNLKDQTTDSFEVKPRYETKAKGSTSNTPALIAKTIDPMIMTKREYRYLELRMR